MNLGSDLGERAGSDEAVMRFVDSASVCCGAHAGSPELAVRTARRCLELGLEVGAHPGYPDPAHFGRVELEMELEELESSVRSQVAMLLQAFPVAYLKPHGALYHRCRSDAAAADAVARVAAEADLGLIAQPGSELLAAAARAGLPAYREGFADRAYLPGGELVPRGKPGSVLGPAAAAEQAVRLATTGEVDTLCVHGDSPDAAAVAEAVRRALIEAGIATAALRSRPPEH